MAALETRLVEKERREGGGQVCVVWCDDNARRSSAEGNKVGRELEGGLFIFCHRLGQHSHTRTHSH